MGHKVPSLRFLALCFMAAIAGLYIFFRNAPGDLGDFALGHNTVSVFPSLNGDKIHCSTAVDAQACLIPALNRNPAHRVLWLGNSQLHAINQWHEGEVPASYIAAQILREQDIDLLAFSQPNASLKEHLAVFATLLPEWKPDILILPVVFDDTREGGVRSDISKAFVNPEVARIVAPYPYASALEQTLTAKSAQGNGEAPSLQTLSEAYINHALELCCGWESLRKRVRGAIWVSLYKFRNFVFRINPTSVRKKIPGIYQDNLSAFEDILALAKDQGITVLVYIAPIRNDVTIPYVPQQYLQFKSDVSAITAAFGANILNLENLVPNALWGEKDSTGINGGGEIDFMHFQAEGHAILGAEIATRIRDLINDL